MRITHNAGELCIDKDISENVGFLLSNKIGGYFNLGISSKYQGLFCKLGEQLFKIIDDIFIEGDVKEIRNNFWNFERIREGNKELFLMPFHANGLVYELEKEADITIDFDVKKPYDGSEWGRLYNISEEDGKIIVQFTKEKDYTLFAVIGFYGEHSLLDEWVKKNYVYDASRGEDAERYVYRALKIRADSLIVSCAYSKEGAINVNDSIRNNLEKTKALQEHYVNTVPEIGMGDRPNMAYRCAVSALDNLVVDMGQVKNIYAGLPWFFQFWSRDTLISLKALMINGGLEAAKGILMGYLHLLQDDGLLPNINKGSDISSADSIGWYFKRWDDFMTMLSNDGKLKEHMKKSDLMFVINKLEESLNGVFRNHTVDCLAVNNSQETWMDTKFGEDGRAGVRIEIQALRLSMYDFIFRLTENKIYSDMVDKIKKKVREVFWTGEYLKDGKDDATIRANIFIAAYVYPEMLSKDEWIKCFDNVLPKLWLEWGGISTLDKNDDRFCNHHTGQSDESYHRGDSWFWVNNLAAIVLHRLDGDRYREHVNKILDASSEEILYKGFIGSCCEISSAAEQSSFGCMNQAWSDAMFIELLSELENKG